MVFFLYLALVITIVLSVFAYQNASAVTLSFYAWEFTGSLALVVAVAFAAGIVTGICLTIPGRFRRTKERWAQRKKIKELERYIERSREERQGPEES